jgi:ABC-type Fe3+/spermidine/putrescine transport system ATPase subunit
MTSEWGLLEERVVLLDEPSDATGAKLRSEDRAADTSLHKKRILC